MQNYEKEFLELIKQRYAQKHGCYTKEIDQLLMGLQKTQDFKDALSRFVAAKFADRK
jgi:hypothetical protein